MNKEFGKIIEEKMKECGYTMESLAERAGVSEKTVYDWTMGSEPRAETYRKLSEIFDVPVETLMTEYKRDFQFREEDLEDVNSINELLLKRSRDIIGINFKRLRIENGRSLTSVAQDTGIALPVLMALEKGRGKNLTMKYCEKLAALYGMDIWSLVEELLSPVGNSCAYLQRQEFNSDWPANLVEIIFGRSIPLDRIDFRGFNSVLKMLPERNVRIMECKYKEGKSLAEAGRRYGLSRERCRQIEEESINHLKEPSKRNKMILIEADKLKGVRQEIPVPTHESRERTS